MPPVAKEAVARPATPMDKWIARASAESYVKEVNDTWVAETGVLCVASVNPWYDDGVTFDWSLLHRRLKQSDGGAPRRSSDEMLEGIHALYKYGIGRIKRCREDGCLCTSVEVQAPWRMQPLSDQAQRWSAFSVRGEDVEEPKSAHTGASSLYRSTQAKLLPQFKLYAFTHGPPGMRTVRDDILGVLSHVEQQLRDSGLLIVRFLSTYVIFGEDFTTLMHQTAAVHKALKEAGMAIDMHGSCFSPRLAQECPSGEGWSSLNLETMTRPEDVALFVTDVFFQWLHDSYVWCCLPPIQVFPTIAPPTGATTAPEPTREMGTEDEDVREKRRKYFQWFVMELLVPRLSSIGLTAGHALVKNGSLFRLAEAYLTEKRRPQGPQRWSVLDVRLVLAQLSAYDFEPAEFVSKRRR